MTRFLLVRHGAHDLLGHVLAGRMPGVDLNEAGRRQAEGLAQRLAQEKIVAIYSSPQARALQTAAPLAQRLQLEVQVREAFDEIDFGSWTGWTLQQLRSTGEPWRQWCEQRSAATPPGGEPFMQVQRRAMAAVEDLRQRHNDENVLVSSHGDVIKVILASLLGISLDHLQRFDIAPGSVSVVDMGEGWQQVKLVNGSAQFQ